MDKVNAWGMGLAMGMILPFVLFELGNGNWRDEARILKLCAVHNIPFEQCIVPGEEKERLKCQKN